MPTAPQKPAPRNQLPQLNCRVPVDLFDGVNREAARLGRKRDHLAERVWRHFLELPPEKRDVICRP